MALLELVHGILAVALGVGAVADEDLSVGQYVSQLRLSGGGGQVDVHLLSRDG